MSDQVPLAEVKSKLSALVETLEREHGRVVITKHGRPAAVLLSIEDLESLEETVAVLSDPILLAELREAESEGSPGAVTPLTKAQALDLARSR